MVIGQSNGIFDVVVETKYFDDTPQIMNDIKCFFKNKDIHPVISGWVLNPSGKPTIHRFKVQYILKSEMPDYYKKQTIGEAENLSE